jgi:hypothetical protein
MYVVALLVYVACGALQVVLSLALFERLKARAPALASTAAAFGLVWASAVVANGMIFNVGLHRVVDLYGTDPTSAATVWFAVDSVFEGLGGGNEILGGIWTLLLSWAALRTGAFVKALNFLGLLVGAAGAASAVPPLGDPATLVFGVGEIVWFAWLGILMLWRG